MRRRFSVPHDGVYKPSGLPRPPAPMPTTSEPEEIGLLYGPDGEIVRRVVNRRKLPFG